MGNLIKLNNILEYLKFKVKVMNKIILVKMLKLLMIMMLDNKKKVMVLVKFWNKIILKKK